MDWAYKAALTATTVALLLAVAQLFGRRIAGILAGLPTVTGPALIWLALDMGTPFAVQAALGSVAASAMCGLFAVGYARASRQHGPIAALAAALVASVLPVPLLSAWADAGAVPGLLLAGVVAVCVLCVAWIPAAPPRRDAAAAPSRRRLLELLITALVSGAVSGVTAYAAPQVGAFWSGVLSSPPLIAAAVAMHLHLSDEGADGAVARFLRGYAAGLIGRCSFAAAFGVLLLAGSVGTAALVATAAGCAVTLAVARTLRAWESRGTTSVSAA
jgi:hypothetical protein